jgi:four helix bundle protein
MEGQKKGKSSDKGLETLQVWQRAMAFAEKVYTNVLPILPVEEKWSMSVQLRRAVQSIPANIAEGYGRFYYQEGIRFCYIARGSLEEAFSHLSLAGRLGYVSQEVLSQMNDDVQEIRRMLNGYIAFLKESKRGENEPGANFHLHEEYADYLAGSDTLADPDALST